MESELAKKHDLEEQLAKQNKTIAELEAELKKCAACEAKLVEQNKTIAALQQKLAQSGQKPAKVKPDDLKVVEGIGPKIEALLHQGGILTFKQLAETEVSRIKELLTGGGPRYAIADPTPWPEQSKLAGEGRWDALDQLQNKLRAGRRA